MTIILNPNSEVETAENTVDSKREGMKRNALWLMIILLILGLTVITYGGDGMTDITIKNLVASIKANDVSAFRRCLTTDFATDMTLNNVATIIEPIAERMTDGYTLEDLGLLRQDGMTVHIYKIVINDGGNDILLRVIMDSDKLAGLLITEPFE